MKALKYILMVVGIITIGLGILTPLNVRVFLLIGLGVIALSFLLPRRHA